MATTEFDDLLLDAQDALFECDYVRCINKCEEVLRCHRSARGVLSTDAQLFETLCVALMSVHRYRDAALVMLRWLGEPFKATFHELCSMSSNIPDERRLRDLISSSSSAASTSTTPSHIALLKQLRFLLLAVYYAHDLPPPLRFRLLADVTQWQWIIYDELGEEMPPTVVDTSASRSSSALSPPPTDSANAVVVSSELDALDKSEREDESAQTLREVSWWRQTVAMDLTLSLSLLSDSLLSLTASALTDGVALVRDGLVHLTNILSPLSSSDLSVLLISNTNTNTNSTQLSTSLRGVRDSLHLTREDTQQMVLSCAWMRLVLAQVEGTAAERDRLRASLTDPNVLSLLTPSNLMFAVSVLTLDHVNYGENAKADSLLQYFRAESPLSSRLDWSTSQLQALTRLVHCTALPSSSASSYRDTSRETGGVHPLLLRRLHRLQIAGPASQINNSCHM
jgi:hypothetical protein